MRESYPGIVAGLPHPSHRVISRLMNASSPPAPAVRDDAGAPSRWGGPGARAVVLLLGLVCSLLITVWEWYHSRLMPEGAPWKGLLAGVWRRGVVDDSLLYWLLPIGAVFLACWCHVVRFRTRYNLWLVLLVWGLPQFLSTGGDMYNYAEQGWVALHGMDPTLVPAGALHGPFQHWVGPWRGTTVGYPVGALGISALAVALGGATPFGTLFFLHVWAAIGTVLVAVFLPRLGELVGMDGKWLFALVALNPMVLEYQLGQGHHDTLAAGLGLAGLWCWLRLRFSPLGWVLGILLTGAAAATKQPALALPLVAAGLVQLAGVVGPPVPRTDGSLAAWGRRAVSAGKALLVAAPLSIGPLFTVFVLPQMLGFGTGWLDATGKPGRWSLPIPRIIEAGINDQRLRHHQHLMDSTALLNWFLVAGIALLVATVVLARAYVWTTLVWLGLATVFLVGGAYYPWYGIWVLVPLLLATLSWRAKATVVALMAASSTFPILHGPGTVPAYAIAWGAAIVAAAAVWWVLRHHGAPAGSRRVDYQEQ